MQYGNRQRPEALAAHSTWQVVLSTCLILLVAAIALPGCGSPEPAAPQTAPVQLRASNGNTAPKVAPPVGVVPDAGEPAVVVPKSPRNLGQLTGGDTEPGVFNTPVSAAKPMVIEPGKVRAAGIRTIVGKHLTLYTDIPSLPAIDELPTIFDAAVPQWAAYFETTEAKVASFKMSGFLMKDKTRFQAAGLIPEGLPDFPNGLQAGHEFWLNEQDEDYYRRHLLLHEGCHGFMTLLLGGAGPPWYMEGMAEYTATHSWNNGQLKLMVNPARKELAPGWGRVRMLQDLYARGELLTLDDIMRYDARAHLRNDPYAWCWAAVTFLQNHPLTADAFGNLESQVQNRDLSFSTNFKQQLADDWLKITAAWQLFIVNICYGYDVKREAVVYTSGAAKSPGVGSTETATINADRGWQSTGIRLLPESSYKITATGKYQIGTEPDIWWSQPAGVTLRYNDGKPLGMVLVALHNDESPLQGGVTPLLKPLKLGSGRQMTSGPGGVLYVRVNEAGNALGDNAGQFTISVSRP